MQASRGAHFLHLACQGGGRAPQPLSQLRHWQLVSHTALIMFEKRLKKERFLKRFLWFALKYFLGLHIKSLINLKLCVHLSELGGELPPSPPSGYATGGYTSGVLYFWNKNLRDRFGASKHLKKTLGVARMKLFVNTHLHCIFSNVKRISKCRRCLPLEIFLRTPLGCGEFS